MLGPVYLLVMRRGVVWRLPVAGGGRGEISLPKVTGRRHYNMCSATSEHILYFEGMLTYTLARSNPWSLGRGGFQMLGFGIVQLAAVQLVDLYICFLQRRPPPVTICHLLLVFPFIKFDFV